MSEREAGIGVFGFEADEDYRRFKGLLQETGYTRERILETLDVSQFDSLRADDLPVLLHRTSAPNPLHTLIRLFLMEVPVPGEAARKAIRPMTLTDWTEAGLIRIEEQQVVANIRLLPFGDLLFASDRPRTLTSRAAPHYVMGIGSSSMTLANLTVRRKSRATLDLGTGCGFQAVLAADHSDRVWATDRNPRALDYTAFNARLNSIGHIECLQGDLFEPVEGDSSALAFDLVVTNPPFVISPESVYLYRDSGLPGDELCRRIVTQVPSFLHDGGYCQMLCNWVETDEGDWHDRLRSWFENSGCDAWAVRTECRNISTYADTWIRHTEKDNPEQFAARFNQWMSYYEAHQIRSIGAGLITLRRRPDGPNWFVAEDVRGAMRNPSGAQIELGFMLQDFLVAHEDDVALLSESYQPDTRVRLKREFEPAPDGWRETGAFLEFSEGLPYRGNIDALVANILVACNGQRPLLEILTEITARLEIPPEQIRTIFSPVARQLIRQGFLLPVGWLADRGERLGAGTWIHK